MKSPYTQAAAAYFQFLTSDLARFDAELPGEWIVKLVGELQEQGLSPEMVREYLHHYLGGKEPAQPLSTVQSDILGWHLLGFCIRQQSFIFERPEFFREGMQAVVDQTKLSRSQVGNLFENVLRRMVVGICR